MSEESLSKNLKILAIICLSIIILYVLLQIGSYFMNLVTLTGISVLLTYILLEPVNFLEAQLKRIKPISLPYNTDKIKGLPFKIPQISFNSEKRILSIITVYLSFVILVIFMATQLIPPAISQIEELAINLPSYVQVAEDQLEDGYNYLNEKFPTVTIPGITDITGVHVEKHSKFRMIENKIAEKVASEVLTWAQYNLKGAFDNILSVATSTLTGVGYLITIIVLSFYFLMDGKELINGFNRLIPSNYHNKLTELEISIHNSLLGFLKGQVLLGIFTGIFMYPVYLFFGVPYAIFLCLFLAIAEIIPVIGSTLGFIPAIIIMLFTDPVDVPFVWLIFGAMQTVKDNAIAPKIVGNIIGLHPVTVIFSIWIGYQVAGFFGILFAIPVASVLNVIFSFITTPNENTPINNPEG